MYTGALAPFHDISWRYDFTGRLLWGGGTGFSRFAFQKLTHYLKTLRPDAVVCTHMIAANAAGGARALLARHGVRYPIISVPTDYETEGFWPHKQTDLFCVGTQNMVETLLARNVPAGCIQRTGLPTAPEFTKDYDKAAMRSQFGLPQDKTIAVVMAGANEPRPYINLRKSLDKAFEYLVEMDWMHFVFCTGKDEQYRMYLQSQVAAFGAKNMTVLGYTDQMAQLMAASNLAICKAGGIAVTECINTRLPIILVGRCYAQEHINERFLTSVGVAYHATTAKELVTSICHITDNPFVLAGMRQSCEDFRKPAAAYDVARATLQLAGCFEVDGKISPTAIMRTKKNKHRQRLMGLYIGGRPAHRR